MKKKKKDDFVFYWEEPEKPKKRTEVFAKPFGFTIKFPRIEMHEARAMTRISQDDNAVIVQIELPGFERNEVSLNVTEDFVEIFAKKKREMKKQTERTFQHHVSSSEIHRKFGLPARVDVNNMNTKLEHGILTIIMPKLEEKKKKKRIEVK